MGTTGTAVFELRAGPYQDGELRVAALRGREALSRLFRFDLDVVADEAIDGAALLDQPAALALRSPGGERLVHGHVVRVEARGVVGRRHRLRLRLMPKLWRLGLTQRSRHFQGKTAPDIVKQVLGEGGIALRAALQGSYPARELCVQYRESDLAFVSRLLEAEGITYFFAHEDDAHTLVLVDAAGAYEALPGPLPFRERGAGPGDDHVFALELARAVRTGAVALGDFDFVRPTLDLSAPAKADGDDAALEDHEHPGDYDTPGDGKRVAKLRLEAYRAESETGRGASTCARFAPGATFELEGHEQLAFDQAYLITAVEHRGELVELAGDEAGGGGERPAYDNTFEVLPGAIPFRPARRTPRPTIAGVQTARVVGPAGEEIHTDEHGRIKVQFHWDREGTKDDASSSWVRVSQAWAGAGWGALYLPRIGMEVVLRFLDGNPDRPVVVGCVYNGENPPPVGLPGEKTKSVLRSSSSKGGGGANELTFEDAAGGEQVYLHAQKDKSIAVDNDKDQTVGGCESLSVTGDRSRTISGQQMLQVGGDDSMLVKGAQTITVTGKRITGVEGAQSETVGKNEHVGVLIGRMLNVAEGATETIKLGKALNVGGAYMIDVLGAQTQLVGGAHTIVVKKYAMEEVIGFKRETVAKGNKTSKVSAGEHAIEVGKAHHRVVGKDELIEVERCHLTHAKASSGTGAKKVDIKADELGLVVDGEVVLIVNKAGTLKIFGKNISIDASSGGKIKGKKVKRQGKGKSASKRLDDKLTSAEAAKVREGSGENPMLSADDVKGFKDGKYTEKVLKKDMVFYRLHDGGAGGFPMGKWVTKNRVPPGLEGKLRCALDPTWSNAATKVAKVKLPAGTRVFEGAFAPQQGAAVGQGQQLCVAVPQGLKGKQVADYLTSLGIKVL